MKITICKDYGPKEVEATIVNIKKPTWAAKFKFACHRSEVGWHDGFTITELSTGHSVAHHGNKRTARRIAGYILAGAGKEKFLKQVKSRQLKQQKTTK